MGVIAYLVHKKQNLPGALVFSLSFVALFSGASAHLALEILSFEDLIDSEAFFDVYRWSEAHIFHVFTMLEMILISVALAAFIRQAESDKQLAQNEKLELMAQTIALKSQYSTQLESEVKQRTHELDQINIELNQLHTMRDRFFGYISHEFRSPLTLALGPLSEILNGKYGQLDKPFEKAVKLANNNARKMLKLVNLILDLASQKNSHMNLTITQVDAGASITKIASNYALLSREKNVALQV